MGGHTQGGKAVINLLAFVVTSILGCLAILFAAAADNGVSPREYAWKLADDLRLALSKPRSVHRGLVVLAWQSFPARWWQFRYVGANPETIWRARVHWLGLTIGILTKSWKKPIVLSRQLRRQIARKGAAFRNEDGQIWRVMQVLLLAMVIPMAMGCAKHLGIEPPGGPAIDCKKTPELCSRSIELSRGNAAQVCAKADRDFTTPHAHVRVFARVIPGLARGERLIITVGGKALEFDGADGSVEWPAGIGSHDVVATVLGPDGVERLRSSILTSVWQCAGSCLPKVDPNWILAAHRARERGFPEPPVRMVEACEASGVVEALDRRIEDRKKRELLMDAIDYYLARSGEAWWSK